MDTASTAYFEHEHRRMDALLHAHLLDVVAADFPRAQQHLQRWRRSLTRHIAIENHQLLPHVPANAHWPARMYLLEHERIELLADEYAMRVDALAARAESQRAFAQSRRSGRRPGCQGVSLPSKSCGCWRISRLRRSTSLRKARRSCAAAQRRFSSDFSACMGVTETGRPSSSTATMVK